MSEIVVVYELDQPVATRPSTESAGGERPPVHKVHAAPTAPGSHTETGPRTLCGKDTFAMVRAARQPAEQQQTPWYPAEHQAVVCPECDAVVET
ncbi:hypothetical protein [Streptomyces sp. NPDC003393]